MLLLYLLPLAIVLGVIFGYLVSQKLIKYKLQEIEKIKEKIKNEADKEVREYKERLGNEIKETLQKEREEIRVFREKEKMEWENKKRELSDKEANLHHLKRELEAKEANLLRREKEQEIKERTIKVKIDRLDQLIKEANERLIRIANIDVATAKEEIWKDLEEKVKLEAAQMAKEIREKAIRTAEADAREIILQAIQRCAIMHTQESTVTVISLPSEELKGRIIGREGRNIRTFETQTGVEVLIDDTPGVITLSAFDPLRRAIAKLAMEKLVADGRIHPARIEEVVEMAKREIAADIEREGEACAVEMGLIGIAPELLHYIGKMKYRTSYGQNLLVHSKEVALLASLIAQELKLDPSLAKRAGVLHDIGKIADHTQEGTHAQIGAEIARRFNEDDIIVNAIAAHHEEVPFDNPYSFLVAAADGISGSRPGSRHETIEAYVKRIARLEEIAQGVAGVEKAYAIQAGREVRVLVDPEAVSDAELTVILQKILNEFGKEIKYPGQIKVSVIREKKTTGYLH